MPVMTHETLDQMETSLKRREAKLASGWAQYTRERESMKQEIEAGLKKEFSRLEALQKELAPKVASMKKAKEEASMEIEKLTALRDQVNAQQTLSTQSLNDLSSRQAAFHAEQEKFETWRKEENRRISDEKSLNEGVRVSLENAKKASDSSNELESNRLKELASKLESESALQKVKSDELVRLVDEATRKNLILTGEISLSRKSIEDHRADLDKREARYSSEMSALVEGNKLLLLEQESVKAKTEELDRFAKGLEKSKVDVEILESKVKKREVLVNALVEKHGLKEELKVLE